jgi:hypothetical protein
MNIRLNRRQAKRATASLLALWALAGPTSAAEVLVPAGTTVYAELQQRLTSKKGIHRAGDPARATVWQDVTVDGKIVIVKGTPISVKIKAVEPKRLTSRRGSLELEAATVGAIDGTDHTQDCGYDNIGNNRVALASSLASAIAWSVTVLKGKEAVLPPGTIFDTQIKLSTPVQATAAAGADPEAANNFTADILYDSMTDKAEHLPMDIRRCGIVIGDAAIVTVNAQALAEPVPIEIISTRVSGKCVDYRARVELKRLGKHFGPGINYFELTSQGERTAAILGVEL